MSPAADWIVAPSARIPSNVPVIAPLLEQMLGFQIMPGDVYYVTKIPSELELPDVAVIAVSAFVLTSLATLYPALRLHRLYPRPDHIGS